MHILSLIIRVIRVIHVFIVLIALRKSEQRDSGTQETAKWVELAQAIRKVQQNVGNVVRAHGFEGG